MPQFLTALTISHTNPASNFHLFTFQVDQPEFNFLPGQYITIKVASAKINKYSLAAQPKGNKIELIVDVTPEQEGSRYLKSLRVGDEIQFLGPFGNFVLQSTDLHPPIFMATGSGIASLKPMIENLLTHSESLQPIYLYFGLRFPEDIFLKDYFDRLAHQYPHFHFYLSLSKPNEKWEGEIGHITDLVKRDFPDTSRFSAYLCGSSSMIHSAIQLLTQSGTPPERIYHEKFFDD